MTISWNYSEPDQAAAQTALFLVLWPQINVATDEVRGCCIFGVLA